MISNNIEFFAAIDSLGEKLAAAGQADLSRDLLEAKTVSSVPGEIFGELQLELTKVVAQPAIDQDLAELSWELLAYLQKIL